jgi:hypothetical protein
MQDIRNAEQNMTVISMLRKYTDKRIGTDSIKKYIGQGLPKLTPVEIVGYEVDEAGSPLT